MSIIKMIFLDLWWLFTICFIFLVWYDLYDSFTKWGVIAWGISLFYINFSLFRHKKK